MSIDRNAEANFDLLYLMLQAQDKYDGLCLDEIQTLLFLSFLMSVYGGKKTDEWGYQFSHGELGGPATSSIVEELILMEQRRVVENNDGYYKVINSVREHIKNQVNVFITLGRFSWRVKYLDAAYGACIMNQLPAVTRAIKEDPELKIARDSSSKEILYPNDDRSYDHFVKLREATSDFSNDILTVSSIWINYLSKMLQKEGKEEDV